MDDLDEPCFSPNELINVFKMLTDRLDTIEDLIAESTKKNQDQIDRICYYFNIPDLDRLLDRHNAFMTLGDVQNYVELWNLPPSKDHTFISMMKFLEPFFLQIINPLLSHINLRPECSIFVNPDLILVHANNIPPPRVLNHRDLVFVQNTFPKDFFWFLLSEETSQLVKFLLERFSHYHVAFHIVPPHDVDDDWEHFHGTDANEFCTDHQFHVFTRIDLSTK